jgi:DNA-binding response OmpR family regulator
MTARRILLVDDSPFIGEALGLALRKVGFEVQVARDLWDFEREDVPRPDLVIMDVVLQEAFGDDVAVLMRATGRFDCPIILMSSLPDDELKQRSIDAGLDGHVSKRLGLRAIVDRVRALVGDGASPVTIDVAGNFEINARQRLRRVLHVASRPDHWNAPAIVAEMHALAGDADLVHAATVAEAARTCRDAVQKYGAAGSTAEIRSAIDTLARLVDTDPGRAAAVAASQQRKLLILDDSDFSRGTLLPLLDRVGHVVVEARTPAEARQKLRAADYDLILLDAHLMDAAPSLSSEIKEQVPNTPLAILSSDDQVELGVADAVMAKSADTERLLAQIEQLTLRR